MKIKIIFLLLLVINNLTCVYSKSCPKPCECTRNCVDCRHKALKLIPSDIPIDTTYLDLSFNMIKSLLENSFKTLKNLKILKLSHNEMKSINENAFFGLTNLRYLHLEHNDLSYIHLETFNKGLNKLLHVFLGNNEFETIPTLKAIHMTKLNLDNNKISNAFINESFLSNIGLETLILTQNEIKLIKNEDFVNLKNTKLRTLTLKLNNLELISEKAFVPLRNTLINLELEGNKLLNSSIIERALMGFTGGASGFQYLDLKRCGIQSISKTFFEPFFNSKLHQMDLSENTQLKMIDNDAFRGLVNLQFINLAKCKISNYDIRLNTMIKLRNLFMNENNLSSCPHRLPASLEILHLQSNDIRQIRKHDFKSLTNLRELRLEKNAILSIEIDSFVDLVSLKSLNVGFNRLTKLESGIFYQMPRLISLNLEQQSPGLSIIGPNSLMLSSLESIEFQNNQIKSISEPIFDKLPKLLNISLKANQMRELDAKLFIGCSGIRFVDLSMNGMIGWHKKTFVPLRATAIDIRLNMNKITSVSMDSNRSNYLPITFRQLQRISLENNQWDCSTCQGIWWLLRFRQLIGNQGQILCNYPNQKAGRDLFTVMANCSDSIPARFISVTASLAKAKKSSIVSWILVSIVILIIISIALIYRYRKKLQICLRKSLSPSYGILNSSYSFENPLSNDLDINNENPEISGGSLRFLNDPSNPLWEVRSSDLDLDYDFFIISNELDQNFEQLNVRIVRSLSDQGVKSQIYHCNKLVIDYPFGEMEILLDILQRRNRKDASYYFRKCAVPDDIVPGIDRFCTWIPYNPKIENMLYDIL